MISPAAPNTETPSTPSPLLALHMFPILASDFKCDINFPIGKCYPVRFADRPAMDLAEIAKALREDLELEESPVQISYLESPPAGVTAHVDPVPSSCTFWGLGRGRSFWAELSSHRSCEIGAYVLGVPPEGELGQRLTDTLGRMQETGYLRPQEPSRIPHLSEPPRYVYYGPLGERPIPPTVAVLFVRPASAMLVAEAASPTGAHPFQVPLLGRPACAVVPYVLTHPEPVALSLACTGFRTYAQPGEDKLLVAIRGPALPEFARAVHHIREANEEVEHTASSRLAAL
jgi:uncharacterized protein (DUF169 family)